MKDKILSIASDLRECFITTNEAVELLKELLENPKKKAHETHNFPHRI